MSHGPLDTSNGVMIYPEESVDPMLHIICSCGRKLAITREMLSCPLQEWSTYGHDRCLAPADLRAQVNREIERLHRVIS